MKRLSFFAALLILLCGCSANSGSDSFPRTAAAPAAADSTSAETSFTLLWYVNGSDLESGENEAGHGGAFTRNLQEMLSFLPADDRFNIVIFSGGTEKWETVGFEAQVNQVHFITKNGLTHGRQLPQGSIADPDTLAGFINYAISEYPADRYGLVFWDHGNSVPIGFGMDELQEPRSINVKGIASALKSGLRGARLAFIGFDTCLMAAVETAALCAPYADYLIASEELEPNGGWNYTPVMYELSRNPSIDTLKLCKTIANVYYNTNYQRNPDDMLTISVTDLSKISSVVAATEKLALAAQKDMNKGGFALISKRRAGAKYFGGVNESADMVDLVHLAQRLRDKYPKESKELIAAVKTAVAHNRHSENSPNSNGLSIYFPFENHAILDDYLDVYLNMGFSESYVKLIRNFTAELKAGDADVKSIKLPVKKQNGQFAIEIPDDLDIVQVRAALLGKESDSVFYIYSYIPDAVFDNNKCRVKLPDEWLTFNGILVCAASESTMNRHTLYSVPAIINDRDMNIMLSREASVFTLIGATPDGGEDSIPSPGFIPIVDGDIVTPKYPRFVLHSDREEDGFYLGEAFTVSGGNIEAGLSSLSTGEYYFAFELIDVYENHFLSECVSLLDN